MLFERVNKAHLSAVRCFLQIRACLTTLAMGETSISKTGCCTSGFKGFNDWSDICLTFRSILLMMFTLNYQGLTAASILSISRLHLPTVEH